MTKQPEVGVLVRRALLPELRSIDESKRQITFTASDESVDRYGDVLRVSGWKFDNYKKNPVVLWGHRSSEPPVGKCVEIHTESNPPALVQTVEFADYPFAETVRKLYADKFLRAVSVGFMPLEEPKRISDLEGNGTGGYEFTSMDLLELSCVPVPANPSAIARAVQKGFSESDVARVFSDSTDSETSLRLEIKRLEAEIAALKTPRRESADVYTIDQLCDAVKQAGASVQSAEKPPAADEEITEIEDLVESEHDVTSIADLAEFLR